MSADERALCILCRVGGERVAVRTEDVQKVVSLAQLSRLPRLPAVVAGIAHHRGRMITIVHAATLLFDAPAQVKPGDLRALLLDRPARNLALLVDAVDGIELLRLPPDLKHGPGPGLRVAEHRGGAILAVDVEQAYQRFLAVAG